MNGKRLLRYVLIPAYRPADGLDHLLEDRKHLLYGTIIFLFLGIVYTISVQLAVSRGIGPAVEPFLKIPTNRYYLIQRFWQIPFFFVTTIVFAGIVRLLSEIAGGRGSFERLFSVLCIAQTLPMFLTMWLPETIGFLFFPGKAIFPLWLDVARQVAGVVWPLVITVLGIGKSEKIHPAFAVLFTLIAALPMTALMVIFVR